MADEVGEKCFRQLEDVGCPADIFTMKWSPKMDLIAIITEEGDVWLNRLSWQRVWTIRSSDNKAVSLAWRPDGKVLALGLDCGKIHLVNVENSECLHEYVVGSKPDLLDWVETKPSESSSLTGRAPMFTEKDEAFLPHLPNLPSGGSTVFSQEKSCDAPWDPKRLSTLAGTLSFLVVGDQSGVVTLLAHGMMPVAKVNAHTVYGDSEHCRIVSASLEANIRFLSVVVQTGTSADFEDGTVTMVTYDTTLLRLRSHELEVLSLKYGRICSLLTYYDGTFQAMSEAWEDILLEIDSRLEKYAESLGPETSVSEEFLTLFTCGTLSPELQAFLVHDLTDKGLKKLGKTVESSYSNIQALALKNLQSVSNALLYHLNDLHGMAKWYERFGLLGLSETLVMECLTVLGSLMIKTQELCSVIESALHSFSAFFKWLYYIILQLLEDEVPAFVKRFNQEDVSLIAMFLQSHLARGSRGKSRFSMERVGQYLRKEPLIFQIDHSGNVWEKFLDSNPELRDIPFVFSVCPEKSLATLHEELSTALHVTFDKLAHATEQALSCQPKIPLFPSTANEIVMATQHSVDGSEYHWVAVTKGKTLFYVIRLRPEGTTTGKLAAEALPVNFLELSEAHGGACVIGLDFYDETTLTMLMRFGDDGETCKDTLAQFNLPFFADSFQPLSSTNQTAFSALSEHSVDGTGAVVQRRDLARMKALSVAVSGSRKVACVLSTSRTRVKVFDMDADEEDTDQSLDETHVSMVSTDSGM